MSQSSSFAATHLFTRRSSSTRVAGAAVALLLALGLATASSSAGFDTAGKKFGPKVCLDCRG